MQKQSSSNRLNLFDISKANIRTLHITWFAFFMTFVVWLSLGPMMPFIKEALGLTGQQAKVLLILNVAMTIPARIVVGMLVDKFGPRILFSAILMLGGLISIAFAWAEWRLLRATPLQVLCYSPTDTWSVYNGADRFSGQMSKHSYRSRWLSSRRTDSGASV